MTDILVVGAGPAGISAALTAAKKGAHVTLIDNRPEPGGNIYACLNSTRNHRPEIWKALGSSYREGQELIDGLLSSSVNYLPEHALWHLDPDGSASARGCGGTLTFEPGKVVLATGAQERPMPMPGWTLPGVIGVGAAQILLKAGGGLPDGPIIIVGTGPLPLLYAAQVLAVGGKIAAFVEPKSRKNLGLASRHIVGAWHGKAYLSKGLGYLIKRVLSRIPVYRNAVSIELVGEKCVRGVRFNCGRDILLDARSVLLHDGVVPNVNPGGAAGLALNRSITQKCWAPISNDNIVVAGDAGGILGAKSAKLGGIAAAHTLLGGTVPEWVTNSIGREKKFRSFIDALYPPVGSANLATDDTTICRCEVVTKKQIYDSAKASGADPNRLKTNLRCGMGPCQGRMCALSVENILAEATGEKRVSIGSHRLRNPIVPITMGDLARSKPAKNRSR
ncbi:MAG: FAD-dependent oxidoreductase [Rhodospirillaceae bacterium]